MAPSPGTPSADEAESAGPAAAVAAGASMSAVPALRFSAWSIVRSVLVVAAGLVVLRLVQAAETPMWWIAISSVIAALLTPLSLRLSRIMPTALAIAVVIVGALGAGGFTVYRGLSEVSSQVSELKDDVLGIAQDLEASEQYGSVATEFGLAEKVTEFFEGLPAYVGGGDATEAVQAATSNAGSLVAIGFLLLLLMISGRQLVTGAVAQVFQPPARHEFEVVLSRSYSRLSRHFGFLCARAVTTAFAIYLMAAMVGVRAPTVVGLWFAVWSVVPGIGYVLAALPLVVAAAVHSLLLAAILFVGSVVVQILDLRYIQKPIERATLRIGPASTLLAVVFGVQLYGFGGAIVVLYLTGMVIAIGRELRGGEDRHDLYTQVRRLLDEQDDLLDEHQSSTLPRALSG